MARRVYPQCLCAVLDCGNVGRVTRGWCATHYERWRQHGDPTIVNNVRGTRSPFWKGDDLTYSGAHMRVRSVKGAASGWPCQLCVGQATDWAYDHAATDERTDGQGRRYSVDPELYLPLCRFCHRKFDAGADLKSA